MKKLFLLLMWVSSIGGAAAQTYPIQSDEQLQKLVVSPDLPKIKVLIFDDTYVYADKFLYFAVVYGLAKDGVPTGIATTVAGEEQGSNFVPKCKICGATKEAFKDYAKFGSTYSSDTNPYADLTSSKPEVRHEALKALIDRYTSSFMVLLELSTIEQEKLQTALGTLSKQGMVGLHEETFGSNYCPSCSGATHQK